MTFNNQKKIAFCVGEQRQVWVIARLFVSEDKVYFQFRHIKKYFDNSKMGVFRDSQSLPNWSFYD